MQNNLSNKKIALLVSLVALGLLVLVGSRYSFLTITNISTEEKKVVVVAQDGQSFTKEFLLNDKKSFFLPKGKYRLFVDANGNSAIYERFLSGLSVAQIGVELRPQKSSVAYGDSVYECLKDLPVQEKSIFYPCDKYQGVFSIKDYGVKDLRKMNDPMKDLGSTFTDEGSPSNNPLSRTMSPYKNGFLSVLTNGKTLTATHLGYDGKALRTKSFSFTNKISDDLVSTVRQGSSDSFIFLDPSTKVLNYSESIDSEPVKVDLSKNLGDVNEFSKLKIFLSDSAVYVLVQKDFESLEGHESSSDQEGARPKEKAIDQATRNQKVISYNMQNKKLSSFALNNELVIRKASVSPEGTLIIVPDDSTSSLFTIDKDSKMKSLQLFSGSIVDLCWLNDKSFFYLLGEKGEIMNYDVEKVASFLVYNNDSRKVSSLSCDFGSVSFAIASAYKAVGTTYALYGLSSADKQKGVRMSTFLPTYFTYKGLTFRLSEERENIRADLAYRSGSKSINESELKTQLISFFFEKGSFLEPGQILISL
jgi:hypothetical protein